MGTLLRVGDGKLKLKIKQLHLSRRSWRPVKAPVVVTGSRFRNLRTWITAQKKASSSVSIGTRILSVRETLKLNHININQVPGPSGPGHTCANLKLQAPSLLRYKLQASSPKQQASSSKPQAASSVILDPWNMDMGEVLGVQGPRAFTMINVFLG